MLIKAFERQVMETPNNIAVKTVDRQLSYQQLDDEANTVAGIVRRISKKQEVVALLFEQGVDMITSVIGVLKAQQIYVPLTPDFPKNRLLYMLEKSSAKLLVTNSLNIQLAEELKKSLEKHGNSLQNPIEILNIDNLEYRIDYSQRVEIPTEVNCYELENICDVADAGIAYILYTSGSTGVPKGIMQSCANVYYYTKSYADCISLTSRDRMTLLSSFSHDAAIVDIFSGLLVGACLYPINGREQMSIDQLTQWLIEEEITLWHSIPTLYRSFVNGLSGEEFPHLRMIVLGGENVLSKDVYLYQQHFPTATFVNLYGQSEASFNSFQWIGPGDNFEKVSLGETIEGTEILLVNEEGMEVEPLNIGEIVVASPHVALGYWQDEEKTQNAFSEDEELGRLYWTGDLGRLLLDGSIQYVGRKDFQLKVRGYRVELGEIENVLTSHPQIKEAVVVGKGMETGETTLIAYITAKEKLEKREIRSFLATYLPEYMIPAKIHQLEALPLTANGKTDRGKLFELKIQEDTSEYHLPQNEIEEKIASIWKEVLKVETVDVRENFFDAGGDSIMLIQIHSMLAKIYPNQLTIGDLFAYTTVEKLSEKIQEMEDQGRKTIETKPFPFPSKYFNESTQREATGIFAISFEGSTFKTLKDIASKEDISLNLILSSIFTYVLADTAKEKLIIIPTILSQKNIVIPVEVDLTGISNLSQLFQQISNKLKSPPLEGIYALEDLNNHENTENISQNITSENYHILPLCYNKKLVSVSPSMGVYDLSFELQEEEGRLNCRLIYKEGRLAKDKMKELLNKMVKVVKLLENSHKTEE